MTMITPSYLGETIEYSSLHACRSTLEDPTRKQPRNTAYRLTHTLAGNAALIGRAKLRHIASGMEQLLKENANKLLAENLVLLKDELDAVLDEIQEEITKEKEKTEDHTVMAKEFDKVQMIEILDKLETMLKERNPQCMTLLDDIRAIAGTEDIVNDVENFDFKPAINKIRKKKEEMKNA